MNKQDFCEAFCSKLYIAEVPIRYVLLTPFFEEVGDPIAIYITRNPNFPALFRLEDDGETLAYLESNGVDFDTDSRIEALNGQLDQHCAQFDENAMLLHTDYLPMKEIVSKSVTFVSLMNPGWWFIKALLAIHWLRLGRQRKPLLSWLKLNRDRQKSELTNHCKRR